MASVKFYRGNREKYNATKYLDGIYFSLDTKEIIVNDVSYGYQGSAKEIQRVNYDAPNTIKIICKDGTEHKVVLQDAEAGVLPDAYKGGLMTVDMVKKLEGIQDFAEINVIDTISVDGVNITPVSKEVNIDTTPLKESISRNKVTSKDNSIEVLPGSKTGADIQPTKIGVKLATDSGLQVTEEGLKVIGGGAAETYVGDDKAIVVDSTAVGGKKKVSLKIDTKTTNILTTSATGTYASVKFKKLDVPTSENEVATRYGLVKVDADGTETTLGGDTIDILKDKFLQNVEIGTIPAGQQGALHEALVFTFSLQDGSTIKRYIPLSSILSNLQLGVGLATGSLGELNVIVSDKQALSPKGSTLASLTIDDTGLYIDGLLESIHRYSPKVKSTNKDIIDIEIDEETVSDVTIYKIVPKDVAKATDLTALSQKIEELGWHEAD